MTETIFGGDMADEQAGFDEWDPPNIANVVAFLAAPSPPTSPARSSSSSAATSGPWAPSRPVGEVHRDDYWTPKELVAAKGELFKGISSGVPDFSFI